MACEDVGMDTATKKFVENQTEKLATMVAQGFAEVKKDIQELKGEVQDLRLTKADKSDIKRLEDLINIGMSHRMEETDRVADRLQRLEMRVTRLETSPAAR